MQEFKPDCTINLLIQSQGRPAKYVWACSLVTRDSVRLVMARKFMGIVSRDEAEWSAMLFGLSQARRLLQEKVHLCSEYSGILQEAGKLRDPRIQSMKAKAQDIWSTFRLRKIGKIASDEEVALKEEAARAFSRKMRD